MSAYVDAIIANAVTTANTQTGYANSAAAATMTASQGHSGVLHNPIVYDLTAVEPDVEEVQDATLTYEANRDQLIALLSGQLASFFTTYYPLAADAFDEATNWLVNSITVGGTGISAAVEAQIWQRDRDRVTKEGLRTEAQVLSEFSGRGFSLPPGAAAARLLEIKAAGMGELQASSRDAAIKQAEMEVENVRFAVDQAIKSRMQAMSAATLEAVSGADISARM